MEKILQIMFLLLALNVSATEKEVLNWLVLQAYVTDVKDGNSLQVIDRKGTVHQVRLAGVDAPELTQPSGVDARNRLRELVLKQTVTIIHRFYDFEGRILGRLMLEEQCVNAILASEGLAWYNDSDADFPEFGKMVASARRKKLGLWSRTHPVPPWLWRQGVRIHRSGMEDDKPPVFPRYPSSNERKIIGR